MTVTNDATSTGAALNGTTVGTAATPVFTGVPAITSFSLTSGPPGTIVTITGTNLSGATAASFNGTSATASITANTATSLTVTVPPGATTGSISVTTPGGIATSAASFTVCPAAPTLAGFTLLGIRNQKAIYISSATATWSNAQAACVAVGGNLVTIPDAATNDLLTSATGGALCWIGLNDQAVEGQYRWVSDNSLATFFNWCGGQPDNANFSPTGEDFGTIGENICAAGTWNDTDNNHSFQATLPRFLLELPACPPPAPSGLTFTPSAGPAGTIVTLTGTNLTRISAVSFNGTPATDFSFGSGTTATATVPAGATSGPITVTTISGTTTSAASFTVCPTPATLPGFTLLGIRNQKAIYISAGTATWTAAQAACVAVGGNLVTIPDAATNAFITSATGNALCWIGLNDAAVEGQYRWVSDNSLATFFNWCNNQPDNATAFDANGEDFGTIGLSFCGFTGGWNDANNHTFQSPLPRFLMEIPVCAARHGPHVLSDQWLAGLGGARYEE